MRDRNRINPIIDRLALAWHANPDLRLGQLIHNGTVEATGSADTDSYYVEDENLIDGIEKSIAGSY